MKVALLSLKRYMNGGAVNVGTRDLHAQFDEGLGTFVECLGFSK